MILIERTEKKRFYKHSLLDKNLLCCFQINFVIDDEVMQALTIDRIGWEKEESDTMYTSQGGNSEEAKSLKSDKTSQNIFEI